MTKKEKIISICLTISMLLSIASLIITLCLNKPVGHSFNIERWFNKIKY